MFWRQVILVSCLAAAVQCVCKNNERHLYYKELNCKPIYTSDPECPSSYNCQNLADRKSSKCYYKNVEYDEGAILDSSVFTDSPCTVECRCLNTYDNRTEFTCVSSECPDLFGPPLQEGCVRQYESLSDCCSSKTYCKNEKAEITKCNYKGVEYVEGQKIFPEEEPCKECICGPGFNGTLSEPWCRTISCKYDLYYGDSLAEGCAPLLYRELSCCPIDWKCPSDGQFSVLPGPDSKSAKDSEKCVFGDFRLNIGDKLQSEDNDADCTCVIPPQVFCVKK